MTLALWQIRCHRATRPMSAGLKGSKHHCSRLPCHSLRFAAMTESQPGRRTYCATKVDMKNPAHSSYRLALRGCGMAAIIFCGIAVGALARTERKTPEAANPAVAAIGGKTDRCAECGVIQSTTDSRVKGAAAAANPKTANPKKQGPRLDAVPTVQPAVERREIVVRMQDGSTMVIAEPNLGNWKVGERVKVLAGVN